jgi:hypothetical protein
MTAVVIPVDISINRLGNPIWTVAIGLAIMSVASNDIANGT